ncbi:MAG TPA: hypothetical protein VK905_00940 [Bacillota bacterium]|nr:hypothetical protein [Bacillota bacterium]
MRKTTILAVVASTLVLAVLSVAQAAPEPVSVSVPVIVDVELVDLDVLRVYFANPMTPEHLSGVLFRLNNYTTATRQDNDDNGISVTLRLSQRLIPGVSYNLAMDDLSQGNKGEYDFVAVETIEVGSLQSKIGSRNPSVQMTRNAISMVEAGHEALLEGRQTVFDAYSELDRAIRDFPELELPFEAPDGEFEDRINELVTEAHVQARTALISNRDALLDQVISLEYQREDLLTNLTKARLQSEMAVRQLTLAAETYVFAYHSMSNQLTGLSGSLSLVQRQMSIVDIQVSLGLLTPHEADKLSQSARELEDAVATLTRQRERMVAELNLLLGQPHATPLRLVEPVIDFESLTEEVDYSRDLPRVHSMNLTLQSLAADVAQKAKIVERNASGSPERIIAQYEWQNASIRYAEEERKLALSFRRLIDDLTDKVSSLSRAENELELQSVLLGYAHLRYELGMISALQLESERLELLAVRRWKEEANRDLFMALLRYRFVLDGLTL